MSEETRHEVGNALRRDRAAVHGCSLLALALASCLPFVLFGDALFNALAQDLGTPHWLAVGLLMAGAASIVSPLFGLSLHVHREASTLLRNARRYRGLVLTCEGRLVVSIATHLGPAEVSVSEARARGMIPGTHLIVYACPEDANAAAMIVHGQAHLGRIEWPRLEPSSSP